MANTTPTTPPESITADAPAASLAIISPALMIALQAAVFMVAAEARVISPLLPAIAQDFRAPVAATGLLITAYTIPYGLFQLVYGPLADRFSRQKVMGVAICLFALGTLVSGFAPNLLALDLMRLFSGAAAAGVIPVALAYVGDAVPYERRQSVLGQIVSIAALGGVLSAALGGVIAQWVSWRVLFIGYGVLALLVGAVLLRLPVTRAVRKQRQPGLLSPYLSIFQVAEARAWALYALVFFEGFCATSTIGLLGAFLAEVYGLSYAAIGGLLMLNGIANMVMARFVGALVRRIGERGMMFSGSALMTVAYVLVGLRPMMLFFPLGMLLSGAGFAIAHSTLQTRATELVPERRGTAVALFAFSLFLGGGIGTALASYGIEHLGYLPTILVTAGLLAVFTACSVPLLRIVQKAKS